jgi:nucleotide-binding universal stress UspA family protein
MSENSPIKAVYSILVGVDYSEVSESALAEAVTLARIHELAHIHVVHCAPGMPPLGLVTRDLTLASPAPAPTQINLPTLDMSRDVQVFVERVLNKFNLQKILDGVRSTLRWTTHLRVADPIVAIVQLAADIQADLVVVGTHGRRGLARFLLGSVAEGVVRRAPCPVLVVRPVGAQAATDVPAIEPPCPQCLETRRMTEGAQFWCDRHREHHERAHTYHFTPFRDSHQSGTLLHPLD